MSDEYRVDLPDAKPLPRKPVSPENYATSYNIPHAKSPQTFVHRALKRSVSMPNLIFRTDSSVHDKATIHDQMERSTSLTQLPCFDNFESNIPSNLPDPMLVPMQERCSGLDHLTVLKRKSGGITFGSSGFLFAKGEDYTDPQLVSYYGSINQLVPKSSSHRRSISNRLPSDSKRSKGSKCFECCSNICITL